MSEEPGKMRRFGLPRARRAALDRLAEAYADDDIELSDYEQRTTAVHAAEDLDELQRIMHDVPDFDVAPPVPRTGGGENQATAASHPLDASPAERPELDMETTVQLLGDREYSAEDARGGLRIVSILGDTTVDLRDLRAGERVVLCHISLLGDLTLLLPRGCRLRRQHLLLLGDENRREPRKKERKRLGIPEDTGARGRSDGREEMHAGPPPEVQLRGFKLLGDVTLIEV